MKNNLLGFYIYFCNPFLNNARVAKLVDALPSGGSVRKDVLVRIQSRVLTGSLLESFILSKRVPKRSFIVQFFSQSIIGV